MVAVPATEEYRNFSFFLPPTKDRKNKAVFLKDTKNQKISPCCA